MRSFRAFAALWLALFTAVPAAAQETTLRPQLTDRYGIRRDLDFFKRKRPEIKVMALLFMNHACPIVKKYRKTLIELNDKFRARGVELFGVYSNQADTVVRMNRHAFEQDYPFPVLQDAGGRLARAVGAERSATAVVLAVGAKVDLKAVRYLGAIDDAQSERGQSGAAVTPFLAQALDATLAGRTTGFPERTEVSGCEIDFPMGNPRPETLPPTLTYNEHIAPIVQKHCQQCHRPGEVAPFSLLTYADAKENASTMAMRVSAGLMPPWHATLNAKYGRLEHENRLTQPEIDQIVWWSKEGAVEGPGKAPANPAWPDPNDWSIGKPDYIYEMPAAFKVPATGALNYQFFNAPLGNTKDLWVKKMEIRPGARGVVHHIVVHIVKAGSNFTGPLAMLNLYGLTLENMNVLNGYVPGDDNSANAMKDGEAQLIPAGSDFIFEMHYTPNGEETLDRSKLGLVLTDVAPKRLRRTQIFRKPRGNIDIPAGHPHWRSEQIYYFKQNVELVAIYPHMHARGKDYKLEIVQDMGTPRESAETLLSLPVYDFNWQRTYNPEKPIFIKAGTPLRATIHWDNSPYNPSNPDPKRRVPFGIQTTDEMFSTRFNYVEVKP